MPSRDELLKLLAHLDQQIELARGLASSKLLTEEQRKYAAIQLKLRRDALERVEKLLNDTTNK